MLPLSKTGVWGEGADSVSDCLLWPASVRSGAVAACWPSCSRDGGLIPYLWPRRGAGDDGCLPNGPSVSASINPNRWHNIYQLAKGLTTQQGLSSIFPHLNILGHEMHILSFMKTLQWMAKLHEKGIIFLNGEPKPTNLIGKFNTHLISQHAHTNPRMPFLKGLGHCCNGQEQR